jgi:hypothetical protein
MMQTSISDSPLHMADVIDGQMGGHLERISAQLLHRRHGGQLTQSEIEILHRVCCQRHHAGTPRHIRSQLVVRGLQGPQQVRRLWLSHGNDDPIGRRQK